MGTVPRRASRAMTTAIMATAFPSDLSEPSGRLETASGNQSLVLMKY
jgi:hypothetical protein